MSLASEKGKGSTFEWFDDDFLTAHVRLGWSTSQIAKRIMYWVNRRNNYARNPLTEEELKELRYEIAVLAELDPSNPTFEHTREIVESMLGHTWEDYPCVVPTQDSAQKFLQILSDCMNQLKKGHSGEIGPIAVSICINRKDRNPEIGSKIKKMFNETVGIVDQAIYSTASVIQHCGALVEICPECSLLFLADRINQKYCSSKCLSRVTTRRSREGEKAKEKEKETDTQKKQRSKSTKSKGKKK